MLADLLRKHRARPLVLVASADDERLAMYSYALSGSGFDVTIANDGKRARALALFARPDVILVDVTARGDDDWSLVQVVKNSPGIQDVPVVAVTCDAAPPVQERARHEGCAAVCVRSCPTAMLAAGLLAVIGERARAAPQNRHR
jgi:CheY-like chemotaxis protein